MNFNIYLNNIFNRFLSVNKLENIYKNEMYNISYKNKLEFFVLRFFISSNNVHTKFYVLSSQQFKPKYENTYKKNTINAIH